MPNIMSIFGYHVYFWSNEGEPSEPIHVHISKQPQQHGTKIWIKSDGTCELDNNDSRIPSHILNKMIKTIEEFSEEIIASWENHFHEIEYIDQLENDTRDEI